MKAIFKKSIVVMLTLAILFSTVAMTVGAQQKQSDFTVTKISNPDRTYRMGDGLIEGGDRETSYSWCMADRGDYVYIGTNKNIGGLVADALVAVFEANGIDEETVWALGNVLTNGEVPRPQTEEGGYILRCSKETGEIVKLYTAPLNVSFRMAIEHNGNVYFGSYAADAVSSNDILRIDENDNIEVVFSSTNGTSMRAACLMDDKLYFGGVDESYALAEGDAGCKKLAILEKDNEDDSVWNRVADYKDFGKRYAMDPGVQGNITSPIWDICSYDGYIYATVPNASGFAMFKGHPAAEGETANEYGWHWEEVIGFFNGVNNIGLCDDPQGYLGANRGMLSVTATPFVFNDELYVMDFDMTIYSEIYAVRGILNQLMKDEGKPSQYLASMYATMQHPQSIWKLDNETGKYVKCEGFSKVADNPCTEYLWRTAVYDGELYVGTMDSATIYNYVTRLTNESFINMTPQEWRDQINYIKTLIGMIKAKTEDEEVSEEITDDANELAEVASNMMDDLEDMDLDADAAEDYVCEYVDVCELIQQTIEGIKTKINTRDFGSMTELMQCLSKINVLNEKLMELYNSVDWEGLEMYAYISDAVKDDVWGFEIFKTADGENFEPVTINGFGDKYNYGARTLLSTDNGLYIGTANPFYGTQLFLLKNNEENTDETTVETTAETTETSADTSPIILGDVDGDGKVTVIDANLIQKKLASVSVTLFIEVAADVDKDGKVTVLDAAFIQKYLASLTCPEGIGEPIA
ncbi:MAG: dockerin type I repeat-containing protein [Ruminococcus sp.]|nr:dockerin type I repeat-containing protein [Ruminococcus sp.]